MSAVSTSAEFIKIAAHTASHYGFEPVERMCKDRRCKRSKKMAVKKVSAAERKLDQMHGILTSGISTYYDSHLYALNEPTLFFSITPVPRSGEVALSLHTVGVQKSIAEALLIQTLRSLLTDLGYERHCVRINSLGDRDSITRYTRELTNYLKKRLDDMPVQSRELMKDHVIVSLMDLVERKHEMIAKCPSPMEYLSDASRRHFREIIEFLDMSETPYEIDNKLLRHHRCYSDALFSFDIRDEDDNTLEDSPIIAEGGRYDEFVRRTTRSQVPAASAVVILKEKKAPARIPKSRMQIKRPVFVVQLGFCPKIKSLMLIDKLKRANIPVHQNLISDSLGEQLRMAESRKVPYTLIVGQKEFVEGTVIVRDMISRSQESIPIGSLVSHLRKARV